jgi:hypothetical protein
MGIDGIGRPPVPPVGAPGGTQGIGSAEPTKTFQVGAAPAAVTISRVSAELERLQRGELSLDEYLDQRVEQAVGHLVGKIGVEQLDFVKQSLREQLGTDPVLTELVRRTTGVSPAMAG